MHKVNAPQRLSVASASRAEPRAEQTAKTRTQPPASSAAHTASDLDRNSLQRIPGADRFELLEAIASGGQGTVFRAYDREHHQQLAIKVFHQPDADAHRALKGEFRSLSRLRHPGVVRLYELHVGPELGFFTMEYLDGTDIHTHCSPQDSDGRPRCPPPNWNAIRLAAAQLALAIDATHAAGLLHLDIKPSNVRVTSSGRVVLLDFGLVRRAQRGRAAWRTVGGTRGYMAPEQVAATGVSEASDWYAFGLVLYLLLTGERSRTSITATTSEAHAPDPTRAALCRALAAMAAPADLAELSLALLCHVPEQRPNGKEVLARLAALAPHRANADLPSQVFVGRHTELRALESALAALGTGAPAKAAVVSVTGPPGVGKSVLAQRFTERLEKEHRALVVSGRCFERAMIPYRLVDELMDRLATAHYQSRLGKPEWPTPLHLGGLFPVFMQHGPGVRSTLPEGCSLLRSSAAQELVEILQELSGGLPLVLWLDDVQWSDEDSIPLLLEIVARSRVPTLFLLTGRGDGTTAQLVEGLSDLATGQRCLFTRLELRGLSSQAARDLVMQLAPATIDPSHARWTRVAGNPLQLIELVRHESTETLPSSVAGGTDNLLSHLYIGRFARLEQAARQYLELVALADQPLHGDVLQRAGRHATGADPTGSSATVLESLCRASLVRVAAGSIEPAHDTIRKCVRSYLLPAQCVLAHRALAEAHSVLQPHSHDVMAYHLEGAGQLDDCLVHLRKAADAASATLAFARAASLYERAHTLSQRVQGGLGARPPDTAGQTRVAHRRTAPADVAARRAIECHLLAGRFEQADSPMRELLKRASVPTFRSERHALRGCLVEVARLLVRGLPAASYTVTTPSATERLRLDACQSALRGYSTHATFRGAVYGLIYLRLARDSGEPRRIVLGIVHVASFLTFANLKWAKAHSKRLLLRGKSVANGDPELLALLDSAHGTQELFAGRWRSAFARLGAQREGGPGRGEFGPEWTLVDQMSLIALDHLGRMHTLRRKAYELLESGLAQGNAMVEVESRVWCGLGELAAGNLPEAWQQVTLAEKHAPACAFLFVHWAILRVKAQALLYEGKTEQALLTLRSAEPALRRSGLMTIQFIRIAARELRALATAGEAAAGRAPLRAAIAELQQASHLQSKENTPQAQASRHLIVGNVALLRRCSPLAARAFAAAEAAYTQAEMPLHAQASRYCSLSFGPPSAALEMAKQEIQRMGVASPTRWALALAPASTLSHKLGAPQAT